MFLIENFMFLIETFIFFNRKFHVFDSKFHVFNSKFQIFNSNSDVIDAKYHKMALFASALFLCSPLCQCKLMQICIKFYEPVTPSKLEKVQKKPELVKQAILIRANWNKIK
jgi:hypothetical protein